MMSRLGLAVYALSVHRSLQRLASPLAVAALAGCYHVPPPATGAIVSANEPSNGCERQDWRHVAQASLATHGRAVLREQRQTRDERTRVTQTRAELEFTADGVAFTDAAGWPLPLAPTLRSLGEPQLAEYVANAHGEGLGNIRYYQRAKLLFWTSVAVSVISLALTPLAFTSLQDKSYRGAFFGATLSTAVVFGAGFAPGFYSAMFKRYPAASDYTRATRWSWVLTEAHDREPAIRAANRHNGQIRQRCQGAD